MKIRIRKYQYDIKFGIVPHEVSVGNEKIDYVRRWIWQRLNSWPAHLLLGWLYVILSIGFHGTKTELPPYGYQGKPSKGPFPPPITRVENYGIPSIDEEIEHEEIMVTGNSIFNDPDPVLKKKYDSTISMQLGMDHNKDVEIYCVSFVKMKPTKDNRYSPPDYKVEVERSGKVIFNNGLFLYIDSERRLHTALASDWELIDINGKIIILDCFKD